MNQIYKDEDIKAMVYFRDNLYQNITWKCLTTDVIYDCDS